MSFKGFSSLLLTVFVLISTSIYAEGLQFSKPTFLLLIDSEGIDGHNIPFDGQLPIENKQYPDSIDEDAKAQSKKRDSTENRSVEIEFEPSFGYSVNDPAIRSLYGKDLGTFREHFGNVPIFGFSLNFSKDKKGIKLGTFYQRSNPSYFSVYQPNEYLLSYTMIKCYFQVSYDFHLFKIVLQHHSKYSVPLKTL